MNEKLINGRVRMSTVENERTGINLKKIIQKNNSMLKTEKEISNYYEEMKKNEELNDDIIFEWYKTYKLYKNEEINIKCKNLLNEIKILLEEYIMKQIEKNRKKDSKVKPDIIKKYKDIINEGIIQVQLNDETKNFLEKL